MVVNLFTFYHNSTICNIYMVFGLIMMSYAVKHAPPPPPPRPQNGYFFNVSGSILKKWSVIVIGFQVWFRIKKHPIFTWDIATLLCRGGGRGAF